MPLPGRHRAATRLAMVVATVVALPALAGCGTPSNLDHQEKVAFARECASLVERHVGETEGRRVEVGSDTLNLADAAGFYSVLERIRGASTYNLHDPKHNADTARQPLDDCNPKTPLVASKTTTSTTSTSTSTSTTTTTTVPGS